MTKSLAPARLSAAGAAARPRARHGAALLAALALAACDFPTAPPIFETRFVIPGEETTLSVRELLPSSISEAGGAFRLTLSPVVIPTRTLGQMCPPCTLIPSGTVVPKPAFTADIPLTVDVPEDVVSASVTAAAVTFTLTQNFGFDPLQPSGRTEDGYIAVRVRNGARVLAVDTVRGAFPSGSTKTLELQLAPGVVTGDLEVLLTLYSPAGGSAAQHWVPVNQSASLSGSVVPGLITIASADVVVQDRNVSVTSVQIDFSDLDESVTDRVQSGALVLDIVNPLAVAGTLNVTLTGGTAGTITKQVQVGPGTSTRRVEFTGAELRSLLGNVVTVSIAGPVSAPSGTVTVTPGQQVSISTRLDLVLEIGGSGD